MSDHKHPTVIVPNVHLPDGYNLVPLALHDVDAYHTVWGVQTPEGFIDPLCDFDRTIAEEDTLIPWPFLKDWVTDDDFEAIGWKVESA